MRLFRKKPGQVEVLLTLALDHRAPNGSCPAPEEIAELIEVPIHKYRREMLDHIVRCKHCYAVWLDAVEMTATVRDEHPLLKPSGLARAKAGLWEWMSGWRKTLFGGGLAVALTGILIVLIWQPAIFRQEFSQYVEYGYGVVMELRSEGFVPETFAWGEQREMQQKGFDLWQNQQEKSLDLARQAFGAGVRAGLEQVAPVTPYSQEVIAHLSANRPACSLGDTGDQCRREDALLFEVGRWAALIEIVCQSEANQAAGRAGHRSNLLTAFWKSQHTALAQLSKELAAFTPPQGGTFQNVIEEWVQRMVSASPPLLCSHVKTLLMQGLNE